MDLRWKGLHPSDSGIPTVLELRGVGIARLHKRTDNSWFVCLDYHKVDGHIHRDCSSYEAGRQGAEMWARRHAARLDFEADTVRATWIRLPGRTRNPELPTPSAPLGISVEQWHRMREVNWALEIKVAPRRVRRRR